MRSNISAEIDPPPHTHTYTSYPVKNGYLVVSLFHGVIYLIEGVIFNEFSVENDWAGHYDLLGLLLTLHREQLVIESEGAKRRIVYDITLILKYF